MTSIAPSMQPSVQIMAPSPMIGPDCRGVDAGTHRDVVTNR